MALTLLSVIAAGAAAGALVLARDRGSLRRDVASASGHAERLGRQLAQVTAERDELAGKVEWLTAANARVSEDAAAHRARADELAARLDAPGTAGGDRADGHPGTWELLLAHVTRRWAAVVGAPPGGRALVDGGPADQLAQALAREVERLREEVGVDVELTFTEPVEPRDGVLLLLSAIELLGALATSAERVTVDLAGRLVLEGDGWVDAAGELAAARDRVAAAGARIEAVDAGADRVRLEISA